MNDEKPIKVSHSAISEYISCPQRYKYRRIDKLNPISKSGSLYFGSAIDLAVQTYLKNLRDNPETPEDPYKVFEINWKRGHDSSNRWIWLYNSLEVNYSYSDFDKDLLTEEDVTLAKDALKELNPAYTGTWLDYMAECTEHKRQRAYRHFKDEEHKYFNRLSWLSINRKGLIMIKAFIDEIGPKINKVLMIQKRVTLESDAGDLLSGYIDFVVDLKDIGTIIIDLKTASMHYEELQTTISQQLGIYSSILGPEIGSNKVGFVVLLKNIKKDKIKICKKCQFKGEGAHKTCNNEIDGKRCGGEWTVTINLKGEVQLLTEELTDTNIEATLETVGGVTEAIKKGLFYRNSQSCLQYNGCDYLDYCWRGKMDGLKKE